jgi:hypothetical protein
VGLAIVSHRQGAQIESRLNGARRVVHDLDGTGLRYGRIVLTASK